MGVVCGGAPSTARTSPAVAGPSTTRALVCARTGSLSSSAPSNWSATITVTQAARPCRSGTWSRRWGSSRPSAVARWVSAVGRSAMIHSGRRVSSGADRPACRARFAEISRRSVSCEAHCRRRRRAREAALDAQHTPAPGQAGVLAGPAAVDDQHIAVVQRLERKRAQQGGGPRLRAAPAASR